MESPAVRFNGGGEPWEISDERLARFVLYCNSPDTLTSDIGPFSRIPFATLAVNGFDENGGKEDAYFFQHESRFYEFWNTQGGRLLKKNLLLNKPDGSVDVCVLESKNGQEGMWYGWKPADIVTEARGDIKLFNYFQLSNTQAEMIKEEVIKRPQRPQQLLQSVFPNAFIPTVDSEGLRHIFDNYVEKELERVSHTFPYKDLSHINSLLGISLAKDGEVLSPSAAFERLRPLKDNLIMTAIAATRLSRYAPQQSLWFGDLREISDFTKENVESNLQLLKLP